MESYINFGAGGCPKQVTKIPNQKSEPKFVLTGQLSTEIFQHSCQQKFFDRNISTETFQQKHFDRNIWKEIF